MAQLAALLAETTQVYCFYSLVHFARAAQDHPAVFGAADTYIHADADDIDAELSRRTSAAALAVHGEAFMLRGDGTIECWWRPARDAGDDVLAPLEDLEVRPRRSLQCVLHVCGVDRVAISIAFESSVDCVQRRGRGVEGPVFG